MTPRASVLLALLTASATARAEPHHTVSVELFGKGGLWGLGYEWQPQRRFALGAVGSWYMLGGEHYATFSPYVSAYPVAHERHRWFVQLGPQLVHRTTPSPGPEWQGMSTTGYDLELSSGYERRGSVVLRAYAMTSVGARITPWLGASIGWSL